jgi:cytoskeletal protein CcmA (bactofilin family)
MTISTAMRAAFVSGLLLSASTQLFAMDGLQEYVSQQNRVPSSDFGSLTVHGPMSVDGDLIVGGELKVYGPTTAGRMNQVQAGQLSGASVLNARVIDGPLTLSGNVIVAGDLRVDGPLIVKGVLSTAGAGSIDSR